jgi:DNA modification methylase
VKPYYQDDYATIIHGDARELLNAAMNFDLILTDPPYGTEADGDGYGRRQLHSPNGRSGAKIANDSDLSMIYETRAQLYSALKYHGYLMCFCSGKKIIEAGNFLAGQFSFYGHFVWDKKVPGLGYSIRYEHENILVFKKNEPEKLLPQTSVIRCAVSRHDSLQRHPHEKPTPVLQTLLSTVENWNCVLDPFCGSGSTLRAAKNLNKKAIGFEIDEKWCELAARRMQQEVLDFSP